MTSSEQDTTTADDADRPSAAGDAGSPITGSPATDSDGGTSGEFERLSGSADPGIVREFIDFLRHNKKWWLAPILVVTLLLISLVFLTASPAAPFIYTLF